MKRAEGSLQRLELYLITTSERDASITVPLSSVDCLSEARIPCSPPIDADLSVNRSGYKIIATLVIFSMEPMFMTD